MLQPYIDSAPHSLIRWIKRFYLTFYTLLTMRASEQGKVIGMVTVYVCVCTKKNYNLMK